MNTLISPIKHIPFQTPLSISGSSRTLVTLDLDLSALCLAASPSMFAAEILASSHDCSSPLWFLVFLSFFCLPVSRKGLCYNYNCLFLGYGL